MSYENSLNKTQQLSLPASKKNPESILISFKI